MTFADKVTQLDNASARAFAGDARAIEIARYALARFYASVFPVDMRLFFYMPFGHSEQLADQQFACALFETIGGKGSIVYMRGADDYFLCINAGNIAKDLAWIREQAAQFSVTITDRCEDYALLAVQGPRAVEIVQSLTGAKLGLVKYYHFTEGTVAGVHCLISRTGYTGEDGFELYHAAGDAVIIEMARRLQQAGIDRGHAGEGAHAGGGGDRADGRSRSAAQQRGDPHVRRPARHARRGRDRRRYPAGMHPGQGLRGACAVRQRDMREGQVHVRAVDGSVR